MTKEVIRLTNIKEFNKIKLKDISPWLEVQGHNGYEAVHFKILRIDPKNTGKFIAELTTYFVKDYLHLKKGDLVIANVNNIDLIYKK